MGKAKARCPRCRGSTLRLREVSDAFQDFEQVDGRIDPEGWNTHGHIREVLATCAPCGHTWKLRGVTQIWDLEGYPRE